MVLTRPVRPRVDTTGDGALARRERRQRVEPAFGFSWCGTLLFCGLAVVGRIVAARPTETVRWSCATGCGTCVLAAIDVSWLVCPIRAAQQLVKDMDDTQVGVAGDSSEEECSTDESAASSLDASRAALASVAVFAVLCSAPAFVVAVGCSVEVTGGSRHLAKADVARLTGCGWVQAEKSVEGTWCLAVVAGWATIARALRAFMCFIPMLRCWRHRQEPRAVYQYWAT